MIRLVATAAIRLAVIIPMYNEERMAEACGRAVCAVLRASVPGGRLFVVNDGSRDATGAILERLSREEAPLTYIDHGHNRGYGAALMTGARVAHEAGFTHGLFMDSDLTNNPALIPHFLEVLGQGGYDLVKASRYIPGGGMDGVPYRRQLYSIWGNRVASRLFRMGIKDCTNGFRAVRLSLIHDIAFRENGFPIILEELYHLKRRGAQATEIPYTLTARQQGEGRSKFTVSWNTIWGYFKYALLAGFIRWRPAARPRGDPAYERTRL
jgi:dolichol-phosphate mannosyltransferase